MNLITKLRNHWNAYWDNHWAKQARDAESLLRRLTPDGLDPEDPNDALTIGMLDRLAKQQEQARNRKRVEAIKQIAYRLMEHEVMAQHPTNRKHYLNDAVTKIHYKMAQDIYDSVERVSDDLELLATKLAEPTNT